MIYTFELIKIVRNITYQTFFSIENIFKFHMKPKSRKLLLKLVESGESKKITLITSDKSEYIIINILLKMFISGLSKFKIRILSLLEFGD